MLVTIRSFVAPDRIAKERLGEFQVADILRDNGQIVQTHCHPWMIVAQNSSIDLQCAFVGLLGQCPLLLTCIHLCEIVQQSRDVSRWSAGGFQNIQAAIVEILGIDESVLSVSELAQSPECASGFLAGGAEFTLRKRSEERRVGKECRSRWWP